MRILLGVLLLGAAAAWANPGGEDREAAEAKEKLQALLDEAALLEKGGHPEEAAKVREEAAALKRKIEEAHGRGGERDDPRMQALHNLEKAIGALDKAGYEGMARELRGMADRLRQEIKGDGGRKQDRDRPGPDEMDFIRRNMDTLRIAMKGLAEAGRHDGAELMERAIQQRELILKGRAEPVKGAPGDAEMAELLARAGQCWLEFKKPDFAELCVELSRAYRGRVEEARHEEVVQRVGREKRGEQREGPGPEERMARLEERLDRMERMLHQALERLEERERER